MKKSLFTFFILIGLFCFGCTKTKDVDYIVERNIPGGRLIQLSYTDSDNTSYFYELSLMKDNDNSLEIRHYSVFRDFLLDEKIIDFYDLEIGKIEKKNDRILAITINGIRYYNTAIKK